MNNTRSGKQLEIFILKNTGRFFEEKLIHTNLLFFYRKCLIKTSDIILKRR